MMPRIIGYYKYSEEAIAGKVKPESVETVLTDVKPDQIVYPVQLDLGESAPGVVKRFNLIVKNEHPEGYPLELRNPQSTDRDLKIEKYPKNLKASQFGIIEFLYAPSMERISPLNAKWGFEVVVG